MLITSIQNNKIKELCKLKEEKNIQKESKFLIEGFHLVEEAYKKDCLLEIIALENIKINYNIPITYVNESVMKKLTNMKSIPQVIGVSKLLKNSGILGNKIVLLDDIQDPGNLGTIIRSCVAFNVSTLILSDSTVNIYNDKVIRSSQGMIYNLNIVRMNLETAIKEIKQKNIPVIGTTMKADLELSEYKNTGKYAIVLGNEGSGIKDDIINMCDELLNIEMNNICESLNVGVSCGIILYNLRS